MDNYIWNQLALAKELLETGVELNQPKDVIKSIHVYQNIKTLAKNAAKNGKDDFWKNVVENMIRACSVMCVYDSANAKKYLEEACKYDDNHPVVLNNLGFVYHTQFGDWDKSISSYDKCLLKDDKYLTAYLGIIDVYRTLRHHKIELEYCKKAAKMCPEAPEVFNSLGLAMLHNHQYNKMMSILVCFRHALDLKPNDETRCKIFVNVGHVHGILGDFSLALNYYLQAIEADARHHPAYQNILLNLHYFSDLDFNDVNFKAVMKKFSVVRHKGETIADILTKLHVEIVRVIYGSKDDVGNIIFPKQPEPFKERTLDRKISIGYISADLVDHAVSYFASVLFSHYNKDAFDVYIYANNVYDPDAIANLQCPNYRCIKNASAADVVSQMKNDAIDILIDLSSHTSGNRLDVVALRPVPIILSYLGYPDDTGFPFVRRISDEFTERCNRAKFDNGNLTAPIRLPRPFLCYKGHKDLLETDFKTFKNYKPKGTVTFGCYAKLQKINKHLIAAWIEILKRVPNSRLILKSRYFQDPAVVKEWKERFGIAAGNHSDSVTSRVVFWKGSPGPLNHLKTFKMLDIHLDTFPYSGTTITTESLYMNVPIVTLSLYARSVGHVQRVSGSILQSMGLEKECVAKNVNEYVEKAVKLVDEIPHLPSVRKKILMSPIAQPQDFMKHFERTLLDLYLSQRDT